jgi:BclB C-terminal domain-containing protein
LLGFGSSAPALTTLGPTIDLTGAGGNTLLNFAFSVPRDGTITSLAAYFSTTAILTVLGTSLNITAQIYSSPTPNNIFSPIGTPVILTFPGPAVFPIGTFRSGIVNFSSPVTAGTRLLMVFSATETGGTLINAAIGYASAGFTIV